MILLYDMRHENMKFLLKIIDKYQSKYPGWLFQWLIRKHWLFPEPKMLRKQLFVSESMAMRGNARTMQQEVVERMIDEIWEELVHVWKKYSYTPSYRNTTFTVRQDFESQAKIFTLTVVCSYNPHWTFGQVRSFVDEIMGFFTSHKL